jgi:hypothetical protein
MSRLDATNRFEDLKAQLGSEALRQESQNRPVKLVFIAGVVLVASTIFLAIGISKRFSADAKLDKARTQATEMLSLADRLDKLKAASQQREGGNLGVPIESIRSRIMSAGTQAGLKSPVQLPRQDKSRGGADAVQQRLTYDVHDESLDAIVRWIEAALAGTSGLEVYALSIRPETNQWNCKVTFSRWEWDKGT